MEVVPPVTTISMRLTLGVNTLVLATEIKIVLYYLYNVGAPVWSAKASMCCQISLVFFTALYMHLIYPSVDSKTRTGCISNFQQTVTPIIV